MEVAHRLRRRPAAVEGGWVAGWGMCGGGTGDVHHEIITCELKTEQLSGISKCIITSAYTFLVGEEGGIGAIPC